MSLLQKVHNVLRQQIKCAACSQIYRKIPQRHYADEDKLDPIPEGLKTKASALSRDLPSTLFIKSYNRLGFTFSGGIQIFGPCIVFPKSVLHWSVRDARDIHEDSLSLFAMLEPKLDILVLGVGDQKDMNTINPEAIIGLRKLKINLEILTTDQALQTFNFLNSENRYVGGAFIPATVEEQRVSENDIARYIEDHDDSFWMNFEPEDDRSLLQRLSRENLRPEDYKDSEEFAKKVAEELMKNSEPTKKRKK